MITVPRWLLLMLGVMLAGHWMPYLATLAHLGLRVSWGSGGAESAAMVLGAWLLVERFGRRSC